MIVRTGHSTAQLKADDGQARLGAGGSCHHLTDTGGGAKQKRCDAYPQGLENTLEECCALCAPGNAINCSAWIHSGDKPGKKGMCWPMEYVIGTRPNPGNVIGGTIAPGPPPGPLPPQPPLPTTGECEYQPDTIYEQVAGGWQQRIEATSAGQCCAICRSLPQCFVANYQLTPQAAPTSLQSACILNGKTDLSRPTHKPNATACVVKTRPKPPAPAPAGAMNVLYFVSGKCKHVFSPFGSPKALESLNEEDAVRRRATRAAELRAGLHQSAEPRQVGCPRPDLHARLLPAVSSSALAFCSAPSR